MVRSSSCMRVPTYELVSGSVHPLAAFDGILDIPSLPKLDIICCLALQGWTGSKVFHELHVHLLSGPKADLEMSEFLTM